MSPGPVLKQRWFYLIWYIDLSVNQNILDQCNVEVRYLCSIILESAPFYVRVSKVLLIILWPCGMWSESSQNKQDIGDVVTMLGDVCTGHMSPWYLGPVSCVPIVTAGQHQIGGVSPAHRVSVMHMGARRNIRGWHQHQICVWKLDLRTINVKTCSAQELNIDDKNPSELKHFTKWLKHTTLKLYWLWPIL